MSLITNKDNVYFMAPFMNGDYGDDFSNFMEKSFTIYVKCKLVEDSLQPNNPSYLFSRNGKHTGISLIKDNSGTVSCTFSYWVNDNNGNSINKIIRHVLPGNYVYNFNEYMMICDDEKKTIKCFINNLNVGSINYENHTKEDYSKAFIWFGCGTMFAEEEFYLHYGQYEYELTIGLDKSLTIDETDDLKKNYTKDLSIIGDGLPIINDNVSYKKDIKFLIDFKNQTKYKIWNLVFNGHNPQLYIKDNILF